ncbi:fibronectin type III domain-containing protein [Nocardiopsis dassonvillei]|uniref:fibronectin type III domain-containing protein n=1 Tax=Nocardiopsis dassonvillei TaxID=2014 RepID=UPI00366C11E5
MVDQPTAPPTDPAPKPRPSPARRAASALWRRTRSSAPGLMISVLAAGLLSTALGAGAMGRADEMSDGAVWLWDSPAGESFRVNGDNARIDLVAALPGSAGSPVQVTQNDDYLLLHDPETGRVTSVDLREMGFSGVLELGTSSDFGLALGEGTAVVIDRASGEVKAVDPATLQPTGPSLRIPAPLVGGAFDDSDTLWLGVPTQGTVVGVRVEGEEAVITQTASVADPGADIAVTVLDDGVLAVDRSGDRMVAVRNGGESRTITSPVPLEGAEVPPRTRGDLAAVTLPGSGDVVTVSDPTGSAGVDHFSTGREGGGTAVPYEGRFYVPFPEDGTVRVFDPTGDELNPITLPGAEGPLELETREGNLYINSPETGVAAVVDPGGRATVIDKTAPPPGPGETDEDDPAPGEPDAGETTAPEPGDVPVPDAGGPEPGDTTAPEPGGTDGGTAPEAPVVENPRDDEEEEDEGTAPGAPTPVSFTAGDGSVTLSWPEAYSPDSPVETYDITWQGGSTTVDGSELEATITGLENGTSYRFRVRASNAFGTGPAAQTEEVTPSPRAPGAPSGVAVAAAGSDSVTVSWEAAEGAADYLVSASSDSGPVSDRTSTGTSVEIAGLAPGGTYTFTVTARGTGGVSGESATSAPFTMPTQEIGAPASVSFSASGDTVTVTWSQVEGATQYTITPHGDGSRSLSEVSTPGTAAGGGQLSYTYQPRGSGRCYSFTVLAASESATADSGTTSTASCSREFR